MAIAYMTGVNIPYYNPTIDEDYLAYEYDESLSGAGNGDTVIIPHNVSNIVVTLAIGGGGTSKIQTTTNKLADVLIDNNVVWVDWDNGAIGATEQDVSPPVTAVRQVNISGTSRMMLIGRQ